MKLFAYPCYSMWWNFIYMITRCQCPQNPGISFFLSLYESAWTFKYKSPCHHQNLKRSSSVLNLHLCMWYPYFMLQSLFIPSMRTSFTICSSYWMPMLPNLNPWLLHKQLRQLIHLMKNLVPSPDYLMWLWQHICQQGFFFLFCLFLFCHVPCHITEFLMLLYCSYKYWFVCHFALLYLALPHGG